jgi:hypothetical protein
MQAVDLRGDLNDYLFDPERQIPKAHLSAICKIKKGELTCRYISLGIKGYVCMKKSPMKQTLDQKVIEQTIGARGDNCEGLGSNQIKNK